MYSSINRSLADILSYDNIYADINYNCDFNANMRKHGIVKSSNDDVLYIKLNKEDAVIDNKKYKIHISIHKNTWDACGMIHITIETYDNNDNTDKKYIANCSVYKNIIYNGIEFSMHDDVNMNYSNILTTDMNNKYNKYKDMLSYDQFVAQTGDNNNYYHNYNYYNYNYGNNYYHNYNNITYTFENNHFIDQFGNTYGNKKMDEIMHNNYFHNFLKLNNINSLNVPSCINPITKKSKCNMNLNNMNLNNMINEICNSFILYINELKNIIGTDNSAVVKRKRTEPNNNDLIGGYYAKYMKYVTKNKNLLNKINK